MDTREVVGSVFRYIFLFVILLCCACSEQRITSPVVEITEHEVDVRTFCALDSSNADSTLLYDIIFHANRSIDALPSEVPIRQNHCFDGIYKVLSDWTASNASFSILKDEAGRGKALAWAPNEEIEIHFLTYDSIMGFYRFHYGYRDFYVQKDRPFIFCVLYADWATMDKLTTRDPLALMVLDLNMKPLFSIKRSSFNTNDFTIEDGKIDCVDGHYFSTRLNFDLPVDSFDQLTVGHLALVTNKYLNSRFENGEEVCFLNGCYALGDLPLWYDLAMKHPWKTDKELKENQWTRDR